MKHVFLRLVLTSALALAFRVAGLAQPAPPMPPGTTASHYLLGTADADDPVSPVVFNRFQWWDKVPPMTGAITEPFENEFCPPLARVVGDPTNAPAGFTVNSWVNWQSIFVFVSGSGVTPVEFATRNDSPKSVPDLVVMPGVRGLGPTTLLVNNYQGPMPMVLTGDEVRPSLFFDFERGQRAVGLEFGFIPLPGETRLSTSGESVHLIARDRAGQLIRDIQGTTHVDAGDFTNRIGVRSSEGNIFSVELRFEHGTGANLRDQQAVMRIWHEPLPPAAVKQGAVAVGGFNPDNARGLASLGSITENLPFNCDKAVVLVRGFWLKYHDDQPHDLGEIAVGFGPRQIVLTTTPGGSVTWTPTATMQPRQTSSGTTTDALVYYSIVAWDSQQTELLTTEAGIDDSSDGRVLRLNLFAPDPVGNQLNWGTSPDEATWKTETEALRGHLYAGLAGFRFGADQDHDDVSDLHLEVGAYQPINARELFWNPPHAGGNISDRNLKWPSYGLLSGDGSDNFTMDVHATLLAGRSLRSAPDPVVRAEYPNIWNGPGGFISNQSQVQARPLFVNRTTEPYWNTDWRSKRARGHSFPLRGDVAVAGMWEFEFLPNGPIREIEVEVKGVNYDGRVVDWQEGRGMVTDSNGRQHVLVLPNFASIQNNTGFAKALLRLTQTAITDANFAKPWSSGYSTPARPGIIRNIGSGDVLITNLFPATARPQDHRFYLAGVVWRGETLSDAEFRARRPLQLRPNEELQILVKYGADQTLARDHKPIAETGLMTIGTNSTTVGATLPLLANVRADVPRATLIAYTNRGTYPSYDFGRVKDRLPSPTGRVFLSDLGGIPLKIHSFGFRTKNPSGFSVRKVGEMRPPKGFPTMPPQQEFQVTYAVGQGRLGVHEDTLTVETNGGPYTLPVRIEVIPGSR